MPHVGTDSLAVLRTVEAFRCRIRYLYLSSNGFGDVSRYQSDAHQITT
jgi:hypothetical protein